MHLLNIDSQELSPTLDYHHQTERQAQIALTRQLAAQSTRERDNSNYELALLLAIESGRAGRMAV